MSPAQLWLKLFGLAFGLVALLFVRAVPGYVPSAAMMDAAAEGEGGPAGAARIAGSVHSWCVRRSRVTSETFARPVAIYSWENDAGLFAVTRADCSGEGACRVSQAALVEAPGLTSHCR